MTLRSAALKNKNADEMLSSNQDKKGGTNVQYQL